MQIEENFIPVADLRGSMAEDLNTNTNTECTECGANDPEGVVWFWADEPSNHFVVCVECDC